MALAVGGTASGSAEKRKRLKPSALVRLSELLINHLNRACVSHRCQICDLATTASTGLGIADNDEEGAKRV